MSGRNEEARHFLATRRARVTPEQAGLKRYGGQRRVPGLRREEVAMLAGVSADYYARLEKGNLGGVSDGVLDAVASALQLGEAERVYLYDLARAANTHGPRPRRLPPTTIRPSLQLVLDSMNSAAAFVRNGRLDVLGTNALARALYSPVFDSPTRPSPGSPPNIARFHFLDPAGPDFFPDRETSENTSVQLLRAEAGRRPHDRRLTDLVGELCTRSENFARRWAAHDVRHHRAGLKRFRHPVVGELSVAFEAMELPADDGLTMTVYTAEPGSRDAEQLQLLASWAATQVSPRPDESSVESSDENPDEPARSAPAGSPDSA
ncbi:helix-turn-helix transcriptional regulator [Kineosporia succinea]|uniref:Transcriptional regulator with XRE-family HTH domain n=1 Tax=Kineosporia succinea TaxID=84632 RepID=A0ABT9PEW6_9ACTN|nr:helix-turn-helix transcriptional regulator [Kineosporia succinea]MDP9830715.1 transcriptional regulator with XRE-family HTH domain [Kineosporia succinea]